MGTSEVKGPPCIHRKGQPANLHIRAITKTPRLTSALAKHCKSRLVRVGKMERGKDEREWGMRTGKGTEGGKRGYI